jgi:hypothetical protein
MTIDRDRRRMMQLSLLAALPGVLSLARMNNAFAEDTPTVATGGAGSQHDFDFFLGNWNVRHRRLKKRLASNNEWEEFDGTTHCQPLLGGFANLNDSVVNRSTGTYRSLGLRAFDARAGMWTDWSLDGRDPTNVNVDGTGRFEKGIGTFFADDAFEGKPIRVRGRFSPLTPDSAQWEQAFSPDGGKTWETNYVMRYTRTA